MESIEILLDNAIKALMAAGIPEDAWSVGGGSVLASYYSHRKSQDIDIFINDAAMLGKLSPDVNDIIKTAIGCTEMAKCISVTFPEGKADFVLSSQFTRFKAKKDQFAGKMVYLNDAVEIVIKNMCNHGNQILPDDIFDLAAVYLSIRKYDLLDELLKIQDEADAFFDKLDSFPSEKLYSVEHSDLLMYGGFPLKGKELDICKMIKKKYIADKEHMKQG